jgi:tRNA dimethylallyltransferase
LAEALADELGGEIISVDSAQLYRGMDIGTAKPAASIQARIPHHLIDILEPEERYSAALFAADAARITSEILARGKPAILVGGTMLYFRALTEGLSELPVGDPKLRAELKQELEALGLAALHKRLKALDPLAATRIRASDPQRTLRALEVIAITGKPLSALQGKKAAPAIDATRLVFAPSERAVLHQRIAKRLEQMFEQGFVEEVSRLRARPSLSIDLPSMRSVGYRQVWMYLAGEIDERSMRDQALFATRQLAKRQMTWLRSERAVHWLDSGGEGALSKALDWLRKELDAA